SWAYYGGAYNAAVNFQHNPTSKNPLVLIGQAYCNICNFESYSNAIMGDPVQRAAHIKDATDFFAAIDHSTLPAVSFVKPDGLIDGHPASSKLDLFEGMVKKVMDHLSANPALMAETAFIITFDEGGGYYDSGYIQPLDFFGDGPRIPLIVVSPWTKGGHVNHTYTDHVSILKFIEKNWGLKPLTARSRDNFPNPVSDDGNAYVPQNSPALGDLMDMFISQTPQVDQRQQWRASLRPGGGLGLPAVLFLMQRLCDRGSFFFIRLRCSLRQFIPNLRCHYKRHANRLACSP